MSRNQTADGRSVFATSSSDFALPFGSSRPPITGDSNNGSSSSSSGSSAGFFQSTASSSVPISIPSSPSLSRSFNQPVDANHAQVLSLASGMGLSPSKLTTSGAGLGIGNLPSPSTRDQTNPLSQHFSAQPQSPTLSLSGEGWPPPPFTAFPSAASTASSSSSVTTPAVLFRRAQAISSPARFRRASMLGREITPFHLDDDDRSDDEDRLRNAASAQQQSSATRRSSNQDPDDGDDEMMQVEEDDAMASRAPNTPVMGPPLSFFSTPSTPPPGASSHLPGARPSLVSSALARASASDSGQDSSSSTGGAGTSRPIPRSPSTGPSTGSPLGHGGNRSRSSSLLSSNVVRKAVTRRGNLLPKDRSVARVAASLQDESKPEDSEIASEAKLQKRLGGEATLPRTPRFGPSGGTFSSGAAGSNNGSGAMRASKSPFFGATSGGSGGAGSLAAGFSRRKYMWDDDVDDIRGVFTADGLDEGESSDMSSEEEEMMMYYSRTDSLSDEEDEMRSRALDASSLLPDGGIASTVPATNAVGASDASGHANGVGSTGAGNNAGLSTSFGSTTTTPSGVGSLPKRKNNALWMGFRDKGNAHKWSPSASTSSSAGPSSGVFAGERAAWRRPGGSSAMDLDTSPRVLGATGSATRLSKRKTMGDDRYEPYKRRAVSPMNLGSSLGTTPTNASFAAAVAAAASSSNQATQVGAGGGSNSPLLMPISSPSGNIMYRGIHHHHYAAYASRYSTSPTISRPCTPVNSAGGGTATATTSAIVAMGSFSPAASGSGPGYGSGALGLSISANNPQSIESRMQLEQQEENEALMDEKVGMLGLS